jgi:hypothetical protein
MVSIFLALLPRYRTEKKVPQIGKNRIIINVVTKEPK